MSGSGPAGGGPAVSSSAIQRAHCSRSVRSRETDDRVAACAASREPSQVSPTAAMASAAAITCWASMSSLSTRSQERPAWASAAASRLAGAAVDQGARVRPQLGRVPGQDGRLEPAPVQRRRPDVRIAQAGQQCCRRRPVRRQLAQHVELRGTDDQLAQRQQAEQVDRVLQERLARGLPAGPHLGRVAAAARHPHLQALARRARRAARRPCSAAARASARCGPRGGQATAQHRRPAEQEQVAGPGGPSAELRGERPAQHRFGHRELAGVQRDQRGERSRGVGHQRRPAHRLQEGDRPGEGRQRSGDHDVAGPRPQGGEHPVRGQRGRPGQQGRQAGGGPLAATPGGLRPRRGRRRRAARAPGSRPARARRRGTARCSGSRKPRWASTAAATAAARSRSGASGSCSAPSACCRAVSCVADERGGLGAAGQQRAGRDPRRAAWSSSSPASAGSSRSAAARLLLQDAAGPEVAHAVGDERPGQLHRLRRPARPAASAAAGARRGSPPAAPRPARLPRTRGTSCTRGQQEPAGAQPPRPGRRLARGRAAERLRQQVGVEGGARGQRVQQRRVRRPPARPGPPAIRATTSGGISIRAGRPGACRLRTAPDRWSWPASDESRGWTSAGRPPVCRRRSRRGPVSRRRPAARSPTGPPCGRPAWPRTTVCGAFAPAPQHLQQFQQRRRAGPRAGAASSTRTPGSPASSPTRAASAARQPVGVVHEDGEVAAHVAGQRQRPAPRRRGCRPPGRPGPAPRAAPSSPIRRVPAR